MPSGVKMWSRMKLGQRLAGELFNDVALNVHRHAVSPSMAGLIEQRNLRDAIDLFLKGFCVPDFQVAIHFVDGRVAVAIGEAGGVGHELAHGGRVVGLGKEHFARGVKAVEDFEVRELGMYFEMGSEGSHLPSS